MRIVRAAGHREHPVPGQPTWALIRLAVTLPPRVTRGQFRRNLKKMVITSMGQDVLQRGRTDSELESLNGHVLRMADRLGIDAPYNRTVYELCRERFGPGFQPMTEREVLDAVRARVRAG